MTIVVAGYEFPRDWGWGDVNKHHVNSPAAGTVEPDSAYVIADSLFSTRVKSGSRSTVLKTAQKISTIDLKLSRPSFSPLGTVQGYLTTFTEQSCGVAICGETSLAQQVVEKFRLLAASLRYTWIHGERGKPGAYAICEAGSEHDMAHPQRWRVEWDDDLDFNERELPGLDYSQVCSFFSICFQAVLDDAVPNAIQNGIGTKKRPVELDFVLLYFCPIANVPKIEEFSYEVQDQVYPQIWPVTHKTITVGEIGVLGMTSWRPALDVVHKANAARKEPVAQAVRKKVQALVDAQGNGNVGGDIQLGVVDARGFRIRPNY